MTPPPLPTRSTRRRPLSWALVLPVAPDRVAAALRTVATGEVQVLEREPARLVLGARDPDVTLRVAVELRPHGDGSELVAFVDGHSVAPDNIKASLLAVLVPAMGLAMPPDVPARWLLLSASLPSLAYLLVIWIDIRRRRRADFREILQAVDRAVAPLKTRDERPYRALAPATRPGRRR